MFCIHCGKQLPDNAAFCDQCGISTLPARPPVQDAPSAPAVPPAPPVAPVYIPVYPTPYPVAVPTQAEEKPKEPSMKWFRFLIYFFLFFNATGCIIDGVTTALGLEHENAALLYHTIPGLQAFEISFGALEVLLGAWGVFTRFRLAGRYRNGPKFLTVFFIASLAWEVLYIAGDIFFMPNMLNFTDPISLVSFVIDLLTTIAVPLILLLTNIVYFKKRTHLFTK